MINIFNNSKAEKINYLFFGFLTFVISVVTYWLFHELLYISILLANVISWVLAVSFAYYTNKKWVFMSTTYDSYLEVVKFYEGRVFTLLIEEFILILGAMFELFDDMIVKVFAQIVVIVLNYVISKYLIFTNNKH